MRSWSIAANRLPLRLGVLARLRDRVHHRRQRRDVPDHRHRAVLRVQRQRHLVRADQRPDRGALRGLDPVARDARPLGLPDHRGVVRVAEHAALRLQQVVLVGDGSRRQHLVGVVEHQAQVAQPADARLGADRRQAHLDAREAERALLGLARAVVEVDLLVRAPGDALAPALALVLVDQHDPVLGPLVDGARRARRGAGRVEAVLADARQVEHERLLELELDLRRTPSPGSGRSRAVAALPPRSSSQLALHPICIGSPLISERGRATGVCSCSGAVVSVS